MIHNIRLGHACNSSSAHSIVPAALLTPSDPAVEGEYGWEWFGLLGEDEKMRYLAVTLQDQLDPMTIRDITGKSPRESDYVDHQSVIKMPTSHREEFARDFAEWLRQPHVGIRGGNDNVYPDEYPRIPTFAFPIGGDETPPIARPDVGPDGERFWTLYWPRTGDKIRFGFGELTKAEDVPRKHRRSAVAYGNLPELVDLKVTDYCPFGKDCPWCYMDSTTKGKHASKAAAARALMACASAGVFEIAIGGGEPTLWPHLDWFTREARSAGVTVNMTTKNFAWLKAKANRDTLTRIGAVALSINNPKDLERFRKLWAAHGPNGTVSQVLTPFRFDWRYDDGVREVETTLQCIPALVDPDLLPEIVATAHDANVRMTFLGLKRTGRAEGNTEAEDLSWIATLKDRKLHWLERCVAIDTVMAAQAAPTFEKAGIDPVYYGTEEGAFSCYIDAVTGKLGPSSYAPAEQMQPFKRGDDLGTVFRQAQRAAGLRD